MLVRWKMLGAIALVTAACGREPTAANLANGGEGDYDWRAHLVLSDVRDYGFTGNDWGSAYYRDIMSHANRKITRYTPTTNGHETNHMLNAEVRNATPANDNTVYVENGKAAMVLEPRMSSTLIRNFVPEWVRQKSSKYRTYVVQQTASWPNVLYQFDEWAAYRTDARIAIEIDRTGRLEEAVQGEICINDGAIEFLYFAAAAVRALSVHEPQYLASNEQFRAAFAYLAEESVHYHRLGRGRRTLDCDGTAYLEHFVSSPDNAAIRATLRDWLGAGWTQRVLGF